MSKKLKIKLKHGKAKIKMKGGDEPLPLSDDQVQNLLGAVLYAAANTPPEQLAAPSVDGSDEVRLLAAESLNAETNST